MGYSFTEKKRIRKNFGKLPTVLDVPYLLETQLNSYRAFLQSGVKNAALNDRGLHAAFKSVFPIESYDGNIHLEFDSYTINDPKHSWLEALDEGVTYYILFSEMDEPNRLYVGQYALDVDET